jgi:hypothetical protein
MRWGGPWPLVESHVESIANPLLSGGVGEGDRTVSAAQVRGPYGIRTRVSTLRGWCPRPLDEGTWLGRLDSNQD